MRNPAGGMAKLFASNDGRVLRETRNPPGLIERRNSDDEPRRLAKHHAWSARRGSCSCNSPICPRHDGTHPVVSNAVAKHRNAIDGIH
jgi:hypothetical protein